MKRLWTEEEAIRWLNKTSDVDIDGRKISIGKKGLGGLKACSAYDFLKNHCGYK